MTENSKDNQIENEGKTDLAEYRQWLVGAEQKSQEAFDKTVLSLSGGALGISFVFLKDVIGSNPVFEPRFLLAAWISWALSSLSVLFSFYLSQLSLRHAITQVDAGTIYTEHAGGYYSKITSWLNAAGAILFFVGVCAITIFAQFNLSNRGAENVQEEASYSTTKTHTTSQTVPTTTGKTSWGR